MPRLKSDLLAALLATIEGRLKPSDLVWSDEAALTVVYAAKGYPAKPETGTVIGSLEKAAAVEGVTVFHAGTKQREDGSLVANGGRVLAVTGMGGTISEAKSRAYAAVAAIDWPGGFYRSDIGFRAV